jgi:hypothetical protein
VGLYHGWHDATAYQRFVLILLGVHAGWNPPFFCRQAVEANIVDTINRYELKGAAGRDGLKLPKVRALCGTERRAAADATTPPSVRTAAARAEAYPVNMEAEIMGADAPLHTKGPAEAVAPSPKSVTTKKGL